MGGLVSEPVFKLQVWREFGVLVDGYVKWTSVRSGKRLRRCQSTMPVQMAMRVADTFFKRDRLCERWMKCKRDENGVCVCCGFGASAGAYRVEKHVEAMREFDSRALVFANGQELACHADC